MYRNQRWKYDGEKRLTAFLIKPFKMLRTFVCSQLTSESIETKTGYREQLITEIITRYEARIELKSSQRFICKPMKCVWACKTYLFEISI